MNLGRSILSLAFHEGILFSGEKQPLIGNYFDFASERLSNFPLLFAEHILLIETILFRLNKLVRVNRDRFPSYIIHSLENHG